MDLLPFDLLNLNNYAKYLSGQYQGKHLFQKRLQAAGLTTTMNASKFILKLCLCKFLTSIVFCIRYFNRTHHTVQKVYTPFYRQPVFFFFFSETLPFSSIYWQYCPNKIPGKHKNKLIFSCSSLLLQNPFITIEKQYLPTSIDNAPILTKKSLSPHLWFFKKTQPSLNKGELTFCTYSEGRIMRHQQTYSAICNEIIFFLVY